MATENVMAAKSQDDASSDDVSRRELLKIAGIAATLAVGSKTANAATPPHEAHERAIQRMTQAGAKPVTWVQVMLEWQRDWARSGTHDAVFQIGKAYAGVWGESLTYEDTMRSLGARAPAERR
jgi:hypothetical protein